MEEMFVWHTRKAPVGEPICLEMLVKSNCFQEGHWHIAFEAKRLWYTRERNVWQHPHGEPECLEMFVKSMNFEAKHFWHTRERNP